MARSQAVVHVCIWNDDTFRELPPESQHLYFVLYTAPMLSYCGVIDWRPRRIAPLAAGWTPERVEAAAQPLREALWLIVDESTEEALLRRFIRDDGLMKQPKMAVSMTMAHAAVASPTLRGVVIHELQALHAEEPEFQGWKSVGDLLSNRPIDPASTLGFTPAVTPGFTPSESGDLGVGQPQPLGNVSGSPTPSPSPAPNSIAPTPTKNSKAGAAASRQPRPKSAKAKLPADWAPTPVMEIEIRERCQGILKAACDLSTRTFRDHYVNGKGSRETREDWAHTWANWVERDWQRTPAARSTPGGAHTNGKPSGDEKVLATLQAGEDVVQYLRQQRGTPSDNYRLEIDR